ncbi:MAG TPA: hypothetical protein VLF71_03525 [Candidatus Saccharimonadales bacterium]|nr:hypothetical protein [Candidatus Saccharimonadales bacterium]
MDSARYRPAPHVLRHIQGTDFVAVVGPTGVGKTTLIKAAAKRPGLHMLVSVFSRPQRPDEIEGVDAHFRGLEEARARMAAGEFVTAVPHPSGHIYATAPEDYPVGKAVLLATLSSAVDEFRALPFRTFRTLYVLPESAAAWHARLAGRGWGAAELAPRFAEARESLAFALARPEVQFVINRTGGLGAAAAGLAALATGQHAPHAAQQEAGRRLAQELLASLPAA